MSYSWKPMILLTFLGVICSGPASAQEKAVVGVIPKAQKPLKMDGKLTDWDGAFVTPVHIGQLRPPNANDGLREHWLATAGFRLVHDHAEVRQFAQAVGLVVLHKSCSSKELCWLSLLLMLLISANGVAS